MVKHSFETSLQIKDKVRPIIDIFFILIIQKQKIRPLGQFTVRVFINRDLFSSLLNVLLKFGGLAHTYRAKKMDSNSQRQTGRAFDLYSGGCELQPNRNCC